MEDITLINDDCFKYLPLLDDCIADLIILDPQYNDWNTMLQNGIICQAVRLLKPTGNLICFTKQPFDYDLRIDINHIFRREITWTFTNGGAWVSNKMPLVSFQKIYWCTLNKNFYFQPRTGVDYNDATKDFKRNSKVFEGYKAEGKKFTKSEDGIWLRDHLHFNKPNTGATPAKPLELIKILVKCFCPEGGMVIDPFMGLGTTGKACKVLNRKFIGIEKDIQTFSKIII